MSYYQEIPKVAQNFRQRQNPTPTPARIRGPATTPVPAPTPATSVTGSAVLARSPILSTSNGDSFPNPGATTNLLAPLQPIRSPSPSPIPLAMAIQHVHHFHATGNIPASSSATLLPGRHVAPAGAIPGLLPALSSIHPLVHISLPQAQQPKSQLPPRPVSVPTNTIPLPPTEMTARPASAQPIATSTWQNPQLPPSSLQAAFNSIPPNGMKQIPFPASTNFQALG